ncbi:hypothetical protein IGB42_00364 [Andreprevotia sp. IGB-42]|nr:hypothetical protein IGB42_00364 [Andreprevotia sp. IGB-42]
MYGRKDVIAAYEGWSFFPGRVGFDPEWERANADFKAGEQKARKQNKGR